MCMTAHAEMLLAIQPDVLVLSGWHEQDCLDDISGRLCVEKWLDVAIMYQAVGLIMIYEDRWKPVAHGSPNVKRSTAHAAS